MAILVAGINQDPSPHIPTLDNVDDLGNDTRGFRALYGSNAGQSVLYGDLSCRGILGTLQLATPATPTLTVVGTVGVTTYGYRVVATVLGGDGTSLYTARSTEATIATGNAALDVNNYVRIDWTSVAGATGYRIYRTTGGATQGLIATITNGNTITLNDTGLAGGGESTPTTNITGEFNLAGLASLRATANGTDVALDKIATAGILYLWNRTDGKGLQIEFANNALVFSATAWAIRAAKADASTLLVQAQNAAGGTYTVITVVGAATVANSYITAQVGGTWTLATGQTWTLPAFNTNGPILLGSATAYGSMNETLEINNNAAGTNKAVGLFSWVGTNSGGDNILTFNKSRGAAVGTHTIVVTGDFLGRIRWHGSDGTDWQPAASIICKATGTIDADRVPGLLEWHLWSNAGPSVDTTVLRMTAALVDFPIGLALSEQTAPAAVANKAFLFAQDNGAGKTQLMVLMPTGAAIQLAIEV